ncbi:hypothetical protein K458DRAFT_425341 [Lentithecium fluviatile CBS 122367]|uniref:Uncharacterized protein n=1 Tax=Lentithecium fluviatile CBS 122367 TaxID=1168545 RepID=A0A6G1IBN7_9PLEO|nr:hypothetical protein K458DRAFT_425341 [Lentithecium fluviatile CBS 122367]
MDDAAWSNHLKRSYPPGSAGTLRPVRPGIAVRTGMRGCEVQEAGKVLFTGQPS